MKNEQHISPDELFKKGLEGMEVPYEEASWQDMRSLLDKSDLRHPFLLWFQKNKKTTILTLISIIMITSIVIAVLNINSPSKAITETKTASDAIEKYADKTDRSSALNSAENTTENNGQNSQTTNGNNLTGGQANFLSTGSETPSTAFFNDPLGVENENTPGNNSDPKEVNNTEKGSTVSANSNQLSANNSTANLTDSDKSDSVAGSNVQATASKSAGQLTSTTKTLAKPKTVIALKNNTTIDKKTYLKYDGPFKGVWMGLHFTMQFPETPILQDSFRQNAGFNWQLMSGNLLPTRAFAGYLGFDFGMQFTGRGKNYGVVLDNTSQDSGFTRLSNHSFDFFARSHFEWTRYRLKPYINVFAGPRIFATSQYTESYKHRTDYENSSNTNAYTSVSLMGGLGFGLRYRINSVVSLDARWEYVRGTQTSLVNVDKSSFSGVSNFTLNKNIVKPEYSLFKFGFLFDLGSEEEIVHKEESTEVTEYYRYDSSTNTYVKVNCSCSQWPVSDTTGENDTVIVVKKRSYSTTRNTYYNNTDSSGTSGSSTRSSYRRSSGTRTGGTGGGGGSRGSFPGIKPGGGGVKR